MKKVFLPILIGIAVSANAEVFSLWPFSGHNERQKESAESLLRPEELWSERINVNGEDLDMRVALVGTPLNACLKILKKARPDARFAANSRNAVMERDLPNGGRERILLIAVDGVYPVMQFSMILPAHSLKPKNWPKDFPILPNAVPVNVMYFPKRNAVYGMFRSPMQVRTALPLLSSRLQSMGWSPVSNENALGSGTGEIFLNETKKEILILGFSELEDGSGCHGTIYKRPYSE